jgi:hypothetical protein
LALCRVYLLGMYVVDCLLILRDASRAHILQGEQLTKWECVGILWTFGFMWIVIGQWAMMHIRHGTR